MHYFHMLGLCQTTTSSQKQCFDELFLSILRSGQKLSFVASAKISYSRLFSCDPGESD